MNERCRCPMWGTTARSYALARAATSVQAGMPPQTSGRAGERPRRDDAPRSRMRPARKRARRLGAPQDLETAHPGVKSGALCTNPHQSDLLGEKRSVQSLSVVGNQPQDTLARTCCGTVVDVLGCWEARSDLLQRLYGRLRNTKHKHEGSDIREQQSFELMSLDVGEHSRAIPVLSE